ncbi:sarcosine oxidase subunit delta [Gulosibacter sp. 10]|uniref:sarcosine oxidase subunit delta n=1 Tax=Gulosibacter sp. 10 TaxID=1255570 RepID=UPI00097EC602|nr:sarcosine oxidase subunit delta [Gulosibacter sp. 10]SJM71373.1 Sarcosine oxidase delta subunit [Gulosibacter sp. 10]
MRYITCPWCGAREEIEFSYGAEAHVAYPSEPASLTDTEWAHYVFFRKNTNGVFAERWNHSAGCRRWFNALRDTRDYKFLATYSIGEQPPEEFRAQLAAPTSDSSEGEPETGTTIHEGSSER